jgi:hypothetical protein
MHVSTYFKCAELESVFSAHRGDIHQGSMSTSTLNTRSLFHLTVSVVVRGLACQLEVMNQRSSPSGVNVLQRCIGLVNSTNVGVHLGLATH